MPNKEPDIEYSFALKRIALLEKNLSLKASINKTEEFTFEVALQINEKPDVSESLHIMTVKIARKGEKENIGSLTLAFTFTIPNFQEYVQIIEGKQSLPEDLTNLLNTVVVGTIRGVMFSEFRGTVLANAYLPVLDARKFVKNN